MLQEFQVCFNVCLCWHPVIIEAVFEHAHKSDSVGLCKLVRKLVFAHWNHLLFLFCFCGFLSHFVDLLYHFYLGIWRLTSYREWNKLPVTKITQVQGMKVCPKDFCLKKTKQKKLFYLKASWFSQLSFFSPMVLVIQSGI